MAVRELDYGDAQSRKEYREQRARYERKKKKKKKAGQRQKTKGSAERGLQRLQGRGRELEELWKQM